MTESNIILLNIGGTKYDVARSTLIMYKESMLARMIEGSLPSTKYEDRIFIDRDGELFKHVLDFLRNTVIWIMPKDSILLQKIRLEASYFGISELEKILAPFVVPQEIENLKHQCHQKYPSIYIRQYRIDIGSSDGIVDISPREMLLLLKKKDGPDSVYTPRLVKEHWTDDGIKTATPNAIVCQLMGLLHKYDYEISHSVKVSENNIIHYFRSKY